MAETSALDKRKTKETPESLKTILLSNGQVFSKTAN